MFTMFGVWAIPEPAKLLLDLRGTCSALWGVGMATIRPGFLREVLIFNILSCCQHMCHSPCVTIKIFY